MLTITRDLNVYSSGMPPIISLSQYDSDFQLVFNLYTSDGVLNIPSGTTAQIQGTKKDGNGYSASATISGNTVTVAGDNQITACAGANVFEISLIRSGKVLNTINFIMAVERAAMDAGTIQSDTVLKELQAIIDSAATSTQAAQDAEAAADRAEEAARTLTIDPTLTQSGQAADAKVVGDEITDLKADLSDISSHIFDSATKSGTFVVIDNASVPQVEISAETATLSIKHTGKNILPYPYTASSTTTHGLTFDVLMDGSVHVTGTGDQSVNFLLSPENPASARRSIKAGTYTLSGTPSNGGRGIGHVWLSGIGQGTLYDYGDGVTFTITEDKTYYAKIYIAGGVAVDLLFKPMLEYGTTKTEWEPYQTETITLTDGKATTDLFGNTDVFSASELFDVRYFEEKRVDGSIYVSLKSYGAVGDGLTDDTRAIQSALNDDKILFIPEGTFLFSETLNIPSGKRIVGLGEKSKFKLSNTYTLTPYPWRTGDALVSDQYRYPMVYFDTDTDGVLIDNIAIEGQINAFLDKNFDCLTVRGKNHIIRNIIITNVNFFPNDFVGRVNNGVGRGINVQGADNVLIENADISKCGYECIGIEDASNVACINCNCTHALQVTGQIHRNCKQIKIIGNVFDNTDKAAAGSSTNGGGFTLHASTDYPMQDIFIDNNYIKSAFVFANGGGENKINITNNTLVGGISLNAIDGWRDRCNVIGNTLGSQLNLKSDNAIIACNKVYHTGGGYMISASGNNVMCYGNIPLNNTTRGVRIVDHDGTSVSESTMTKYQS